MTIPIINPTFSQSTSLINVDEASESLVEIFIKQKNYTDASNTAKILGDREIYKLFVDALQNDLSEALVIAENFKNKKYRDQGQDAVYLKTSQQHIEKGNLESALETILKISAPLHKFNMLSKLWQAAFDQKRVPLCVLVIEKIEAEPLEVTSKSILPTMIEKTFALCVKEECLREASRCLTLMEVPDTQQKAIQSLKTELPLLMSRSLSDFKVVVQNLSESGDSTIIREAAELLLESGHPIEGAEYIEKLDFKVTEDAVLAIRIVYGVLVTKYSDCVEGDLAKEPLTEESEIMEMLHTKKAKLEEAEIDLALNYLKTLSPLHIDHVFARRKLIPLLINAYPDRYTTVANLLTISELIDYLLSCEISRFSNECYHWVTKLVAKLIEKQDFDGAEILLHKYPQAKT